MHDPQNLDVLLTRKQTAEALNNVGIPITPATLATKATRGGGPPYRLFGPKPLYRWGDTLDWAMGRLSQPMSGTSADGSAKAPSKRGHPAKTTPLECEGA
jgi:hypothetical protein